jgi:hypothetical protein
MSDGDYFYIPRRLSAWDKNRNGRNVYHIDLAFFKSYIAFFILFVLFHSELWRIPSNSGCPIALSFSPVNTTFNS